MVSDQSEYANAADKCMPFIIHFIQVLFNQLQDIPYSMRLHKTSLLTTTQKLGKPTNSYVMPHSIPIFSLALHKISFVELLS
jgi:hypothetical protein